MDQNQTKVDQYDTDQDIFEDEPLEPRPGTQTIELIHSGNTNGACDEPDVTAAISHIQQLLAELQMKRQGTTISVESTKPVEFRLEEARNAARRTALAEEFAKSSGEAAQRLAKETEIATRQAAAAKPLLEAKALEIEALHAEILTLHKIVDGAGRREADERALRASEDAAKKATLANISKFHAIIAEVQKRQRSLETSMENLEGEVKAAALLLDQEREVRESERLASARDKTQLKKASEQIAALTAEVGAMRARAGAAMASHTKVERRAAPFLTTQH